MGLLDSVLVERGDRVTSGQVLAVLDSQLERADLEVTRMRAETTPAIEIAEAQLVRIEARFEQAKALLAEGIMSSGEVDQFTPSSWWPASPCARPMRIDSWSGSSSWGRRRDWRNAPCTLRSTGSWSSATSPPGSWWIAPTDVPHFLRHLREDVFDCGFRFFTNLDILESGGQGSTDLFD